MVCVAYGQEHHGFLLLYLQHSPPACLVHYPVFELIDIRRKPASVFFPIMQIALAAIVQAGLLEAWLSLRLRGRKSPHPVLCTACQGATRLKEIFAPKVTSKNYVSPIFTLWVRRRVDLYTFLCGDFPVEPPVPRPVARRNAARIGFVRQETDRFAQPTSISFSYASGGLNQNLYRTPMKNVCQPSFQPEENTCHVQLALPLCNLGGWTPAKHHQFGIWKRCSP